MVKTIGTRRKINAILLNIHRNPPKSGHMCVWIWAGNKCAKLYGNILSVSDIIRSWHEQRIKELLLHYLLEHQSVTSSNVMMTLLIQSTGCLLSLCLSLSVCHCLSVCLCLCVQHCVGWHCWWHCTLCVGAADGASSTATFTDTQQITRESQVATVKVKVKVKAVHNHTTVTLHKTFLFTCQVSFLPRCLTKNQ